MITTLLPATPTNYRERGAIMDVSPRAHYLASKGFSDHALLSAARDKFGKNVVGITIKYPRPVKPIVDSEAREALLYGVFNTAGALLVGGFSTLEEAKETAKGIVVTDKFKTVSIVNYAVNVKLYIGLPDVFAGYQKTTANVTLLLAEKTESPIPGLLLKGLTVGDVLVVAKKTVQVPQKEATLGDDNYDRDKAIVETIVNPGSTLLNFALLAGGIALPADGRSFGFIDSTLTFFYEALAA